MCLNSKKPEQDFLLGTKSKRLWMEGILQGSTAQRGRLQQGRHSWPKAEQSLAGAVRHCQTGEGRRTGVPWTPLPRGCREQQVIPGQGEGPCSVWDRDPIQMGMLTALSTTSRGRRKKAQHQRGWGPPSCLARLCRGRCQQAPTPAKMGFQAVGLWSGIQQATGHSSGHLHLLIFVFTTTLTVTLSLLSKKTT